MSVCGGMHVDAGDMRLSLGAVATRTWWACCGAGNGTAVFCISRKCSYPRSCLSDSLQQVILSRGKGKRREVGGLRKENAVIF